MSGSQPLSRPLNAEVSFPPSMELESVALKDKGRPLFFNCIFYQAVPSAIVIGVHSTQCIPVSTQMECSQHEGSKLHECSPAALPPHCPLLRVSVPSKAPFPAGLLVCHFRSPRPPVLPQWGKKMRRTQRHPKCQTVLDTIPTDGQRGLCGQLTGGGGDLPTHNPQLSWGVVIVKLRLLSAILPLATSLPKCLCFG